MNYTSHMQICLYCWRKFRHQSTKIIRTIILQTSFQILWLFILNIVFSLFTGSIAAIIPYNDYDNVDGVAGCCRQHNVPEVCVRTLCYPQHPPNDFDVYDIFEKRNNCSRHLSHISYCLAAGRDHSTCCENEAKDRDEHVCFGMCRGEGRHEVHESWTQYQTCLAINIRSMFQCFINGYENAPTPPRHLIVSRVGAHDVHLTWQPSSINAHVIENYIVYAYQVDEDSDAIDESSELVFETDESQIVLASLESGTLYRVFAVALAKDGKRSLRSIHVDFQTSGAAPKIEAFKPVVNVARNASSAILACRFRINGISQSKLEIEWQHKSQSLSNEYESLRNFRFNQSYFIFSTNKPREHITTLEVYDIIPDDFGTYRCLVSDGYGESSAELELRSKELRPPSAVPPITPLACCKARSVEERCLPMCGGSSPTEATSTKKYVPRPYMPPNCSNEISKVLSCALPEVDDSSCCLRERVPRQCMYLCDSTIDPSNQMAAVCLEHVDAVEQCRISGVEKRPEAIHGMKVEIANSGSPTEVLLVSWIPSNGAEIYHVYWRRLSQLHDTNENDGWILKSQVLTSRKIYDANEIVVIAANSYGTSQASKIVLNKSNVWTPTF